MPPMPMPLLRRNGSSRGRGEQRLDAHLGLIPTCGHTAGSLVVRLGDQILFSGVHLRWNAHAVALVASQASCWWDWLSQLASVAKRRDPHVGWLLPGHGGWRPAAADWPGEMDRTPAFRRAS
jgi:glyoxylase-like metal-dependent hydrolase (beta-lactamase superfamily II)